MPRVLNFYMDDSGTRAPNRKPLLLSDRDEFFALGGVLVNEEDEGGARTSYDAFCARWGINYPLHSTEIRNRCGKFAWLMLVKEAEYQVFMRDLTRFLTSIDVVGLACVIDRPGYDSRYRGKYGRRRWHLCQTAFCIALERAAKFAIRDGRKLRVMPEGTNVDDERRLKKYYEDLKVAGAPFDPTSSSPYAPLSVADYSSTLYELRFKRKSSPMVQIADLYLWPQAKAGYNDRNLPYIALLGANRLIENKLRAEDVFACGSKRSCFDLVDARKRAP